MAASLHRDPPNLHSNRVPSVSAPATFLDRSGPSNLSTLTSWRPSQPTRHATLTDLLPVGDSLSLSLTHTHWTHLPRASRSQQPAASVTPTSRGRRPSAFESCPRRPPPATRCRCLLPRPPAVTSHSAPPPRPPRRSDRLAGDHWARRWIASAGDRRSQQHWRLERDAAYSQVFPDRREGVHLIQEWFACREEGRIGCRGQGQGWGGEQSTWSVVVSGDRAVISHGRGDRMTAPVRCSELSHSSSGIVTEDSK